MGTRNLTAVILGGEFRVAQYGQWDGYLSGAGQIILDMLKEFDIARFAEQVSRCYFATEEQLIEIYEPYNTNGMMTWDQANAFKESKYGYLSRDTGCDILRTIYENRMNEDLLLKDSIEFAKDSLFCEFAYVIDLDNHTLEVYTGFNGEPLDESERFYNDGYSDNGYYPVRLAKKYSFDDLPENFNSLNAELYPEDYSDDE